MDQDTHEGALARRLEDFVRRRAGHVLPPAETERLCRYLTDLIRSGGRIPPRGRGFNWARIAAECQIDPAALDLARQALLPGFLALRRELGRPASARRRGRPAAALDDQPPARAGGWRDPADFPKALAMQMQRHGDTIHGLTRWLRARGAPTARGTLKAWLRGEKVPTRPESLAALQRLEARWRLPASYFRARLSGSTRPVPEHEATETTATEQRFLAWHLPEDFAQRPPAEREEILAWVRQTVIKGATDYRRYHALALRSPFGLRFPELQSVGPGACLAPPGLAAEVSDLVAFKRARFTPLGLHRTGVWSPASVEQRVTHLGLIFGALSADPNGPVRGLGAERSTLSLAHLVFPRVWDWHMEWREARRGFLTVWEADMLAMGRSLMAPRTGWLTQSPALAQRLAPIPGLVSADDVAGAQADWAGACRAFHSYAATRRAEVRRSARVHHDPFEPVLPVLEADSPVREYRRIAEEALRTGPCPRLYPKAAAETLRGVLMIRLGLHLGFRQKNLRQLLVAPRGAVPRTEAQLQALKRGELRWSDKIQAWEVFAPPAAFKNASSSFFRGQAFRLALPDVAGLYGLIDRYLEDARPRLLGSVDDPGTFFVKTTKRTSRQAEYCQTGFYQAWRWFVQRHGIYNRWTGRGAIEGLLPHGPHVVRDILAAEMLKRTGSFEQASYAIQATPETVARHYGRFLPEHKAAQAARHLAAAWN